MYDVAVNAAGDVHHHVIIQVYNGDNVVYSQKKCRIAPGEMESIRLTKEMFRDGDQ